MTTHLPDTPIKFTPGSVERAVEGGGRVQSVLDAAEADCTMYAAAVVLMLDSRNDSTVWAEAHLRACRLRDEAFSALRMARTLLARIDEDACARPRRSDAQETE